MIKSIVNIDKQALMKFFDSSIINTNLIASTPTHTLVFNPALGTGSSSRVGSAVVLDKIDFTAIFDANSAAADLVIQEAFVRVIITQCIGDDTTEAASPLQNSSVQNYYPVSAIDYDENHNQFHVLHDSVVALDHFNRTAKMKFTVRPRIKRTKYDLLNSVWSTGQIVVNVYGLVNGSTNNITNSWYSRVWFNDV
jgi:hypothetical protein